MFVEAYGKRNDKELIKLDLINIDALKNVSLVIRRDNGDILTSIAHITNGGIKLNHIPTWIVDYFKIPVDKNGKIKIIDYKEEEIF